MRVSLRQLQAFVLAAEEGSISGAAARMNLTQSAVSVLIRELERAVGVPALLDRSSRPAALTEAGRAVIQRAQLICSEADLFSQELQGYSDLKRGIVKVASSPAIASMLLAPVAKAFKTQYPGIELQVYESDAAVSEDMIRKGSADIGLLTIVADDNPELSIEPVLADSLSMVVLKSDPNAGRQSISWREVSAFKTISVRKPSSIRDIIDRAMSKHDMTFTPHMEVSHLATVLSLVSEELGCAIIPAYLVERRDGPFSVIPLVNPTIKRTISLCTRRGRKISPATLAFSNLVRKELSKKTRARK
ncbi:LysR family transcriptional regulator [Bradyrhizobium sp. 200]|uniref:LysR family transcriptional regulator n=1 Tax=Bradyrhizobium sp. 200 TaxID=2782665 RepID=UPI001FFFEF45|nr:LysR family transcriptional regulator [Bradyrhizobium sp. 200]UPJ48400.1 LysR family transcriptional regulator [Bradyrhizobium sp. 200]